MAKGKRSMSREKHELRYAKTLAAKEFDKVKNKKYDYSVIIKVRTLKRICKALIILYKKDEDIKKNWKKSVQEEVR